MVKFWLGVVQLAHVRRGVELGIAQTGHGAKSGISRMSPGDGMVFYSPKTDYPVGVPLKEFTAIGTVVGDPPWQAEDGDMQMWRRTMDWDRDATSTPIAPLLQVLDLSRGNSGWGMQLRRGHLEISAHDFGVIAQAMGAGESVAQLGTHPLG